MCKMRSGKKIQQRSCRRCKTIARRLYHGTNISPAEEKEKESFCGRKNNELRSGYNLFYYLWLLYAEQITKNVSVALKRENEAKTQIYEASEFYWEMGMGL